MPQPTLHQQANRLTDILINLRLGLLHYTSTDRYFSVAAKANLQPKLDLIGKLLLLSIDGLKHWIQRTHDKETYHASHQTDPNAPTGP